jgi:hypothetical protein
LKIYFSPKQNREYEESGYMYIADISKLDYFVDNAECTDIILDGYLSILPASYVNDHLSKIVTKIRGGGSLKVIDLNAFYLIYELVNNYSFSLADFNSALEDAGAVSLQSVVTIRAALEDRGLRTKSIRFNDPLFVIEVVK